MKPHANLSDLTVENSQPTLASLQSELAETRRRLAEAEQTLHAIRSGEVEASIGQGVAGPQDILLQAAPIGFCFVAPAVSRSRTSARRSQAGAWARS